jgi:hypothetical protein
MVTSYLSVPLSGSREKAKLRSMTVELKLSYYYFFTEVGVGL